MHHYRETLHQRLADCSEVMDRYALTIDESTNSMDQPTESRAAMTERNRNFSAALGIIVVLIALAAVVAVIAP
jgi:L-amino acid N-acyltransferase YncA